VASAYRDDLEAALARASHLEREVEALRRRNAELAFGDRATIEARENARRLEAALQREREELQQRIARGVEEASSEQASKDAGFSARAARSNQFFALRFAISIVCVIVAAAMANTCR
jgi:hypothetical protein